MKLILELSLEESSRGSLFNGFDLRIVEGDVVPRDDFSREEVNMLEKALKSSGLDLLLKDTKISTDKMDQHKMIVAKLGQLEQEINAVERVYDDKDLSSLDHHLIQFSKEVIEHVLLRDTVFLMELNKQYFSEEEMQSISKKIMSVKAINGFERENRELDKLLSGTTNMEYSKKQAEIYLRYTDLKSKIESDNHKQMTEQIRKKQDAAPELK